MVTYELDGRVAKITMDDGKANALAIPMLKEVHSAFDRAELPGVLGTIAAGLAFFSRVIGHPDVPPTAVTGSWFVPVVPRVLVPRMLARGDSSLIKRACCTAGTSVSRSEAR